ncbi:hypothetical protein CHS0354_021648 [Potamilus streckersoni]|uniref:Uncharacterized protein n=1 Tax=Potamilus streckersoni TaxID=2493646 RepID=A0AAE0VYN8_9BIVA|nr:hypothetical protein CHS0354_021648 [Potamilus streckersoni]
MADKDFNLEELLNVSVWQAKSPNSNNYLGNLGESYVPYTYSPRDIIFIVTLTVILVVIVAIITFLSIYLSSRRSADSDSQSLTNADYARSSEIPEIWSVEGAYNLIAT